MENPNTVSDWKKMTDSLIRARFGEDDWYCSVSSGERCSAACLINIRQVVASSGDKHLDGRLKNEKDDLLNGFEL